MQGDDLNKRKNEIEERLVCLERQVISREEEIKRLNNLF
jgi:chaperonin cofactor prefoldin